MQLSEMMARGHELWRELRAMPAETVRDRRANFAEWSTRFDTYGDVKFESWGEKEGLLVRPASATSERVILHLHGGAYTLGSSLTHKFIGSRLAAAAASPVLLLDYPLAPENPFPAALECAVAAYTKLVIDSGSAEGVAVSGDSAGGGLGVALLLAARERGMEMPVAYVGMSPWVDLTLSGHSHKYRAGRDPFIRTNVLKECADGYLVENDSHDPMVSPLFADLSGLPPMLIQVGTEELLFDDAARLHRRAAECGVDSQLSVVEGAPHVWQQFAEFLPEAQESIAEYGRFMDTRLRSSK